MMASKIIIIIQILCILGVKSSAGTDYCFTKQTAIVYSREVEDRIYKAAITCNPDQNTVCEDFRTLKAGMLKPDEEYKRFLFCTFTNAGYIDKYTGIVYVDKIAALYPKPSVVVEVLIGCIETLKTSGALCIISPIEVTYSLYNCFQNTSPYLIDMTSKCPKKLYEFCFYR